MTGCFPVFPAPLPSGSLVGALFTSSFLLSYFRCQLLGSGTATVHCCTPGLMQACTQEGPISPVKWVNLKLALIQHPKVSP